LLSVLIERYLADLETRGCRERHRKDCRRLVTAVVNGCGWKHLADLDPDALDSYIKGLEGRSARTKATHRQAVVALGNFLVDKRKLKYNPLLGSTKPAGDEVRQRRALTTDELRKIVQVAEERPLKDALLIRWGPRAGTFDRKISEAERERCIIQGRNNRLLYMMAFYTGMRAGELRSLWAGDLVLDGDAPRLWLPKERTKNKKELNLPLRPKFAAELRAWITDRGLKKGDPLFRVPHETAKLLRRDLVAAGIAYQDERKRYADFHALRGSLSSHASAAGVMPATAKELMRHGSIKMTMDTYVDPAMAQLRDAVDRLPDL
jgi:integrase